MQEMSPSSLFFNAYLYFGCYLQLLIAIAGWSLLKIVLRRCGVTYEAEGVMGVCPPLVKLTWWMAGGLTACVTLFIALLEYLPESAIIIAPVVPVIVYPLVIVIALACQQGLLIGLWNMIRNILHFWREGGPSFRDAFVMDLLLSITKALSDMICSWYRWADMIYWYTLFHGNENVRRRLGIWADDPTCGNHYIAVSIAMALPYLIRILQCLGEAAAGPKMWPLVNAVKHSSSLLVILFAGLQSAYQMDHTLKTRLQYGYFILAVVNSVYTAAWDIFRDWQLQNRFSIQNLWPNQHTVGKWAFYSWLVTSDILLRFSWGLKLWIKPPHSSLLIFSIAIAEVLRRYQWAYFRMERQVREYQISTMEEDDEERRGDYHNLASDEYDLERQQVGAYYSISSDEDGQPHDDYQMDEQADDIYEDWLKVGFLLD